MLFDYLIDEPLAYRMRPQHIDDIIGQNHIIGKHTALYRMIQKGFVPSMLLYGVPGIGKTSMAQAIAGTVQYPFISINATTAGKKDIEEAVEQAKINGKLLLFIDEIHRFNKLVQDTLLPHVERGLITLIGATTENPFHEVNPAIRSRCGRICQLKPIEPKDIKLLLQRALTDKDRGLGKEKIHISDECLDLIATSINGDARSALTILEESVKASEKNEEHVIVVEKQTILECIENKGFTHDKQGDTYYDLLSAFQKSIRGSDVNASLHYLARLIEGGDLKAICRRLIVIAYEDISIANPEVAVHTMLAVQAVERLGLPEARIPLANIVVEQCLSPKTNSAYKALDLAIVDVRNGIIGEVPNHLKDTHYEGAKQLGHGTNYLYPHDFPNSWVKQEYLPSALKGKTYFHPKHNGKEDYFHKVYERLNALQTK